MPSARSSQSLSSCVPIVLAVAIGARRGEVLGLRWADVDLDRATASIAQTLEETDRGGLAFKPPKTERSRRLIALPEITVDVLRRHRVRQAEERLRAGRERIDNGLVCCDALGRPLSPRRVPKAFRQLRRSLGLDGVRFHGLCHGHASMLLALGTHPKVVQEAPSHSSVSITLDIYSHLMPGMQRDAANGIDTVLRTHLEHALPQSE